MQEKIRVAVIYGGASGEHPISCATAGAVMSALDSERYEVIPVGICKDGRWVPGESDYSKLQLNGATTEVQGSDTTIVLPPGNGEQELLAITGSGTELKVTSLGKIDVLFPVLHGPFGEDGTIQGLFEMAGIPYVGCGVFASAAGMDKDYMKIVLQAAGIPVGPYVAVTARQWATQREAVLEKVQNLAFPLYVKPARAGSSLGITRVTDYAELVAAIEAAQAHDPKVVIEQGIAGREIECAVLGGRGYAECRASLPGEVVMAAPDADFYDFEHKYVSTAGLEMQVPAKITAEQTAAIRALAIDTFNAFGCEGLTRVDFFLTDAGEILVNEINTLPGFTPFSMYPVMWEKTDMSYAQLVDELISLALERGTGLH